MHLSWKIFLLLWITITASATECQDFHSPKNIATGKSYTSFPLPNYPLTAPSTDKSALTDGIYTSGFFWTKKTTVGWRNTRNVKILIDLDTVSIIDRLTFSTARGTDGGVYVPVRIDAYIGPDLNHLCYVGDIARDADTTPVNYETKRFMLTGISKKGRYVFLDVQLKGFFLFCDEIEVIEGNHDRALSGNVTLEEAPKLDVDRAIQLDLIQQMKLVVSTQPWAVNQLLKLSQKVQAANATLDSMHVAENDLLALRSQALRAHFGTKKFIVESVDTWGRLSPVFQPSGVSLTNISHSLPQRGYDCASFAVTNLSNKVQRLLVSLSKKVGNPASVSLFHVPLVKSARLEYVADPLVPITGELPLRPGESEFFVVTARGMIPGKWQGSLKIAFGGVPVSVPLQIDVLNITFPKEFTLNSVNWGYLDIRPLVDRKSEAAMNLLDHHTNVVVVPPADIPVVDTNPHLDFSRFEEYLSRFGGATKIFLFMNLGDGKRLTGAGKFKFLSQEWESAFKNWYELMMQCIVRAGLSTKQVYLYPYDEMSAKEINQFVALAQWAHKEIPQIKFYATIDNVDALRSLKYLDIAQVQDNDKLLSGVSKTGSQIWIYRTQGTAKSLSPYSYYRLMAWKAFVLGYTGIGFWSYADIGNEGTAWDDFDGKNPDYSVIYEGDGSSIISSRRWEAWRMGIEDYELLTMYAKAKGVEAAKALAKSVLDSPADVSKADEVRQRLLKELSQ